MNRSRTNWVEGWRARHRSVVSFWLHIIGIPLTVVALVLIAYQLYFDLWDLWWRPLLLFVIGYFLQYLGHAYEGNDMGEVILVKRFFGLPYTAVSPRYEQREVDPAN